ncbi:MAG: FmdB family zinc ribbon protein [Halanaerobiales bacterium]
MPTYLYRCENCGKFEFFQSITADPLDECPDCGGEVEKLIGNPGVIFKGTGFYCTDNRSESGEKEGGEKTGEKAS